MRLVDDPRRTPIPVVLSATLLPDGSPRPAPAVDPRVPPFPLPDLVPEVRDFRPLEIDVVDILRPGSATIGFDPAVAAGCCCNCNCCCNCSS